MNGIKSLVNSDEQHTNQQHTNQQHTNQQQPLKNITNKLMETHSDMVRMVQS